MHAASRHETPSLTSLPKDDEVSCEVRPRGGGYLTREVTGVCGKALHTLYPVA